MTPVAKHFSLGTLFLLTVSAMVGFWVSAASERNEKAKSVDRNESQEAAIAAASDEGYCSVDLKKILRRVLTSCGLVSESKEGRGCQPLEAKNVAAMTGNDFNALFKPLAHRAAIIQFDQKLSTLDEQAEKLLEENFADQRGASYFLVVSRASPEGSVETNRRISEERAKSVLSYLETRFNDPDLKKEVGLLWLGEEFAQLDEEFCKWNRSRKNTACTNAELNRSAFVAWIDCRL